MKPPQKFSCYFIFVFTILLHTTGFANTTNYCQPKHCSTIPACNAAVGGGPIDFKGQTLNNKNFSGKPAGYLKGANFSNTTLIGVNFANTDLTNANFSGAKLRANAQGVRTDLSGTTLTNTCFTGADLSGSNMQFSNFNQTDFSCADLSNATFGPVASFSGSGSARTKFNYAKLTIAANADSFLFPLKNMSAAGDNFWPLVDFTCSRLIGLSPKNFSTTGINLSKAKLGGQVLSGYNFYDKKNPKNCNLSGADLSGSDLSNAKLQYCNLDGIKFSHANLSGANFTEADFYADNNAADLTNATLNGTTLNNSTLSHADLAGANFENVQALGEDTNFSNVNMQASGSNNVTTIINSTFDHANFSNAQLNNVTFVNSSLNKVSFRSLTLSGTDFSGSQLVGSDFEDTTLQDVKFEHGNINNANFKSSKLNSQKNGAGVNFTCSQLGGADFTNATVNKANFDAAVMPQSADCCRIDGGAYNCGTAINGTIYGATTVPVVPEGINVDCPNGQDKNCSGTDWKIPHWKTNICDASGQEIRIWTQPTCGEEPKTITINDANLKTCLQNILYGGANQPITVKAAKNLQYLSCANMEITDISVLGQSDGTKKSSPKYFPNLVSIDLSVNNLSGSGNFSNFSTKLESIKISYNKFTNLTFSSHQTSLNTLIASDNKITSLDISPNTYISYLDLSNNQLTGDFSNTYTFNGVTNITYIDLSGNMLTNVFTDFDSTTTPNLNTLSLHNNNITTIGSIKQIWNSGQGSLYSVSLGNNACFECNTLCVSEGTTQQFQCSCDADTCGNACNNPCPK